MTHDIAVIRQRAIESEAGTWLNGDTEGAARRFDQAAGWARKLDADGRRYHSAGAWHANDLLKLAAITVTQIEAGEPTGWHGGPARI